MLVSSKVTSVSCFACWRIDRQVVNLQQSAAGLTKGKKMRTDEVQGEFHVLINYHASSTCGFFWVFFAYVVDEEGIIRQREKR